MIQVNHYGNQFDGEAIHVLRFEYADSVTDKSFFRPELGDIRSKLGNLAGANVHGVYDFPDGKDTGDTVATTLRNKGLDRTEVDAMYQSMKSNLEDKKKLDEDLLKQMQNNDNRKSVDDAIKKIADSVGSDSPSESLSK